MSKTIRTTTYNQQVVGNLRSDAFAHWSGSDMTIEMIDDDYEQVKTTHLFSDEHFQHDSVTYTGVYNYSASGQVGGASGEPTYVLNLLRSDMIRFLLPRSDLLNVEYRPYHARVHVDVIATRNFDGGRWRWNAEWPLPHHGIFLLRVARNHFVWANTRTLTNDDMFFQREVAVDEPPDWKFDQTTHHRANAEFYFTHHQDDIDLAAQMNVGDFKREEVITSPDMLHQLEEGISDFLGTPLPFGPLEQSIDDLEPYLQIIADELRFERRADEETVNTANPSVENDFLLPLDDWLNSNAPISEFIVYRKDPTSKFSFTMLAEAAGTGILGNVSSLIDTKDESKEDGDQAPLFVSMAEIQLSKHFSYMAIVHPTVEVFFDPGDAILTSWEGFPLRFRITLKQKNVRVATVQKADDTRIFKLKSKLAYFITHAADNVLTRNKTHGQFNVWNEGANLLPPDQTRPVDGSPAVVSGKKGK